MQRQWFVEATIKLRLSPLELRKNIGSNVIHLGGPGQNARSQPPHGVPASRQGSVALHQFWTNCQVCGPLSCVLLRILHGVLGMEKILGAWKTPILAAFFPLFSSSLFGGCKSGFRSPLPNRITLPIGLELGFGYVQKSIENSPPAFQGMRLSHVSKVGRKIPKPNRGKAEARHGAQVLRWQLRLGRKALSRRALRRASGRGFGDNPSSLNWGNCL